MTTNTPKPQVFTVDIDTKQPVHPFQFEHFAEAIIESSPDVVVIVNNRNEIVFVNGRCHDLLGYKPQELLGKNVAILVPSQFSKHPKEVAHYMEHPITKAMGTRPVLSAQHKSGAQIPVDISLSPLPTVEGYGQLIQAVIRDAMPRWNTQQDLLVQSVAMNAAANGIVITDIKGIIQWINPAVSRMTGYTRKEMIGSHTRILKSGQHDEKFYKNLWETVMEGKTWFGEITNRRKNGTLYYEEQHIAPVRNDAGQIVRLIAIKQDVTARRQAEMKLKEANKELRKQLAQIKNLATQLHEANLTLESKVAERTQELAALNSSLEKVNDQLQEVDELKSSFLSVISHELRTPFANILMSLQILESHLSTDTQTEQYTVFQQLSAGINDANKMVNSLIKHASFIRKHGVMRMVPIKPGELVETIGMIFKARAERNGLAFTLNIANDLPEILGDEERLTDAMHELITNAIKFTPSGGEIKVRVWAKANMLFFAVQDTGQGIPEDKLPLLWDSFQQMADPIRRGREGLGLGLALVKYIVEAHNGEIWANSQEGVGSTFGFKLPKK